MIPYTLDSFLGVLTSICRYGHQRKVVGRAHTWMMPEAVSLASRVVQVFPSVLPTALWCTWAPGLVPGPQRE